MNAQEQITGVIYVIDHARSVTVSGKPVVIRRDSFEHYPDYEAVLEKLADEYSAIEVIQYPAWSDVEHSINIGMYSSEVEKQAISYEIELLPKFDDLVVQRKGITQSETLKGTVQLSGTKVVLWLSDGSQKVLKTFRSDMPPHNIMKYLMSKPSEPISRRELYPFMKTRLDVEDIDLTEVARGLGFNDALKEYFFHKTTKRTLYFEPVADMPLAIVASLK